MRHLVTAFASLCFFIPEWAEAADLSEILYINVQYSHRPVSTAFIPELYKADSIDLLLKRTEKGAPMELLGFRWQRYGKAELHLYQGTVRVSRLFDRDYREITALQHDPERDTFSIQFNDGWGKRWLTLGFQPRYPEYYYGRFGGFLPHWVTRATWLDESDLRHDPFEAMVIPESARANLPKVVVVGCAEKITEPPVERQRAGQR